MRLIGLAVTLALAGLSAGCAPAQLTGVVAIAPVERAAPDARALAEPTFLIAPFEGVPVTVGERVDRFLAGSLRREGLSIVRREERPHAFRVVGYLTAASDDSSAVVFWTFDILDARSGRLLHRVSGQQTAGASVGDPWVNVRDPDLRTLTEIAALRIAAWLEAVAPV